MFEVFRFLIRTDEQIHDKRDEGKGENEREHAEETADLIACEHAAHVVEDEGDYVSESALIADCAPRSFRVVHFTLDCADSREAGSAKKIEDKE